MIIRPEVEAGLRNARAWYERQRAGLGACLGSALAGVVFDYFQTYRPAFYLTIGLMLAAIVGIWLAAPRTARRTVEARASAPTPRPTR